MTARPVDDDVVVWAVDGHPATRDDALAALASRPLLLLLHGFGSYEGDLIALAPALPRGFVCAAPRAPLPVPETGNTGFAWWPIVFGPDGRPEHGRVPEQFVGSDAHTAATSLLEWLDSLDARLRARTGSGLGTVVPLGFSQGGCMVTSLMRMRPTSFACGVNCSGFVAPGAYESDASLARLRPALFWGRDVADPVIDAARIALTNDWAPRHTELVARVYPGIGHSISRDEIDDISTFLREQLAEEL